MKRVESQPNIPGDTNGEKPTGLDANPHYFIVRKVFELNSEIRDSAANPTLLTSAQKSFLIGQYLAYKEVATKLGLQPIIEDLSLDPE